jgi:NADH-quinone oxidoreductase subunit I
VTGPVPPRARGVIALSQQNCTSCMVCARECPVWCITIESHTEEGPPARPGGRPRTVNVLDRFDLDWSLCMACGICVETCPFDALFWAPEHDRPGPARDDLVHDRDRLTSLLPLVPGERGPAPER